MMIMKRLLAKSRIFANIRNAQSNPMIRSFNRGAEKRKSHTERSEESCCLQNRGSVCLKKEYKFDELIFSTQTRLTDDYTLHKKILLLGDGDFSFGLCLATALGNGTNFTVTSLDSYEDLLDMYPNAQTHIDELKALGGSIIHQVDATNMYQDPRLCFQKYDRIVYNMPHAGFLKRVSEYDQLMISRHQKLLTGYFYSASKMLTCNGEVHVRHHTYPPYCCWDLVGLAKIERLKLVEEAPFNPNAYPTYSNKRGAGKHADESFPIYWAKCSTFKFVPEKSQLVKYVAEDNKALVVANTNAGVPAEAARADDGASHITPDE